MSHTVQVALHLAEGSCPRCGGFRGPFVQTVTSAKMPFWRRHF